MESTTLILSVVGIVTAVAYLPICLLWRSRRLSCSLREFQTGLPILTRSPRQARVTDAQRRLLKVDALIKDGCERVQKQTPQDLPSRSPWMSADSIAAAITAGLTRQLEDLSVAGIDASLYGTLVAMDIDLKHLWDGATNYLKENPEAMMTLGVDAAKLLVTPSAENTEHFVAHFKSFIEHASTTGSVDAADNVDNVDAVEGIDSVDSVDSIDGVDAGVDSFLPDLGPIPVFTVIRSGLRGWRAVSNGHATVGDAFTNLAYDVGGTGGGAAAGAAGGTVICPGVGTVIGAVIGAILGRKLTDTIKYDELNTAKQRYETELSTVNAERHAFVCATYDAYAIMSSGAHAQYAAQYHEGFPSATQTGALDAMVSDLVTTLRADCTYARMMIEQQGEHVLASHTDSWYQQLFGCGIRGSLRSGLIHCVREETDKIADVERRLSSSESPEAILQVLSSCSVPSDQHFVRSIPIFEKALSQYLARHVAEFRCWINSATSARTASISEMAGYVRERAAEFANLADKLQKRLKPSEDAVMREARRLGLCS